MKCRRHHIVYQKYESVSYFCLEPYHLRSRSHPTGSLVSPFVFLLDFLLVVPDIQRKFGKNEVTQVRNLLPEIVISYPNAFEQPSWQPLEFPVRFAFPQPVVCGLRIRRMCVRITPSAYLSRKGLQKETVFDFFECLDTFLRAFCYM
jgi:hypothetical protein